MATCHLTSKQCLKIKSFIMDTNNCLTKIFPAFDSLNKELSPSFHFVDTFPSHFFFYLANQKEVNVKIAHQNKLENIYKVLSNNQDIILIIFNISIKNNITILVLYIWRRHKIIVKTIYYAMNISLIEAKLVAIRCCISIITQRL